MYLLVVVLNHESHVKEILERFIEVDVRGATVIETQGMGRLLSQEIPIFTTFRKVLSGAQQRVNNFTIFSVIRTEKTLRDAIDVVFDVVGDIDRPGTGIMFVLPVLHMYGLANPITKNQMGEK
ncbi:MAG: hypothetical protein DRI28_02230 [Caldiserica bacterium]|nr:MAG: hypothetical protein DRI28_02230 [Caldisericota bacterium]